jgi:hypothetical protein
MFQVVEIKESDHQDHQGYLKEDSKFIEASPKPITVVENKSGEESHGNIMPRMFTVE